MTRKDEAIPDEAVNMVEAELSSIIIKVIETKFDGPTKSSFLAKRKEKSSRYVSMLFLKSSHIFKEKKKTMI